MEAIFLKAVMVRKFATAEEWNADCDRVRTAVDDLFTQGRETLKEQDVSTLGAMRTELLAVLATVNKGIRVGVVPDCARDAVLEFIDAVIREVSSRKPVKRSWWQ